MEGERERGLWEAEAAGSLQGVGSRPGHSQSWSSGSQRFRAQGTSEEQIEVSISGGLGGPGQSCRDQNVELSLSSDPLLPPHPLVPETSHLKPLPVSSSNLLMLLSHYQPSTLHFR